jgi:putative ABC transport system substrate-binding protein
VIVADPVGSGFVASLPRPGGNATGFTPIVRSLSGKWVELLKEIAPRVARVTLLFNPPTATFVEGFLNPFKAAAASLRAEAIVAPVNDMPGLESLIATEAHEPSSGLVVIVPRRRLHPMGLSKMLTLYWTILALSVGHGVRPMIKASRDAAH